MNAFSAPISESLHNQPLSHVGFFVHLVSTPQGYITRYVSAQVEQILSYRPEVIVGVANWWN